ncbi:amidohydrolase [Evansella tamaricis]|uniref:5-methylthioadenosine/S-adenosylhomocysteine deaminase n=1 Tax=Evansella tamaricis TaxID=2069301 RepID=A0ABS6JLS7_9BACI|nr:amidohydrolase [Evansella tamaricis]MBU9714629.1 amidohydrolase [Evansella tamaricis]
MNILLHSVYIITMDEEGPTSVINGFVIIKHGEFDQVKEGKPSQEELNNASEVINGKGKWLIPGLINTHGHLGSSLLRGAGDDIPLMKWLETVMWPNEKTFTEDIIKKAVSLAMVEMVKSGTTTFLDMYHLHMETVAQLAQESEMRAVLCRGMIGLCSEKEQRNKLSEAINLHRDVHGMNSGKITVALSPHAPYTCPPSFLQMIIEKAKENNIWIHTHLSETEEEVIKHKEQYGLRPVEHMERIGLFQVPCLVAHAVHLSDNEITILKENNVSVSHNPMSNLKLGSGIAPIPQMISKGINISLGTDSTASNNNLDMFEEVRFAALLHKGISKDPTITKTWDILRMAMENGAKALQLQQLGKIKKGYKADFLLIDPNSAHLTPWDKDRIHSHLVYSAKGFDVSDVFVQGKQLMRSKELLFLDEEKVIYEANSFLHS